VLIANPRNCGIEVHIGADFDYLRSGDSTLPILSHPADELSQDLELDNYAPILLTALEI
jgi:hypothetical protein